MYRHVQYYLRTVIFYMLFKIPENQKKRVVSTKERTEINGYESGIWVQDLSICLGVNPRDDFHKKNKVKVWHRVEWSRIKFSRIG